MTEELEKELIRDEGMRFEAYKDSLGYWTIGVGHYLGTEKRMSKITHAEMEALLVADIAEAERIVERLLTRPWEHSPRRYRALVNMAFNLGPRLGQFKNFLSAVNSGAWLAAGNHMMQSRWAKQVGQRAVRLREMIENG